MSAARQQAMCVAFANELKAVLPLGVEVKKMRAPDGAFAIAVIKGSRHYVLKVEQDLSSEASIWNIDGENKERVRGHCDSVVQRGEYMARQLVG